MFWSHSTNVYKKLCAIILVTALALLSVNVQVHKIDAATASAEDFLDIIDSYGNQYNFENYLADYVGAPRPAAEYIIEASSFTQSENIGEDSLLTNYEGMEGVSVLTDEEGFIEWPVTVESDGFYNFSLLYYSVEGKSSDIQRAVFIDGALPFVEANTVEFRRTWINELDYMQVDNRGNDLRPPQVEKNVWRESVFEDYMGSYTEPFLFYLTAGTHTITLVSQREPMIIRSLKIFQQPSAPAYSQLSGGYANMNHSSSEPVVIPGETADRKSSPMLYPSSDSSSPAASPYSAKEIKINNIGDGTWSNAGQWIEWDFETPEDGLYKIAFNLKQNYLRGTNVYRKITIDGATPFKELESVPFGFADSWRVDTLGGEEQPYLFHLTKGKHTLRMEVVLGDYAKYVREITESVLNLNTIYRQIIMITGIAPDIYRDYQINRRLPNLRSQLDEEISKLDRIYNELVELSGGKGQRDTVIRTMTTLLKRIRSNPETEAPKRLGMLKSNVGSLSTWLMEVRVMTMAIDTIYILPPDAPTPKVNNGFFARLWHEISALYYSFIIDYNAIGNVTEDNNSETVTVWVGLGRDQANAIKSLIDEDFTKNYGINVNLMLVQMDTLLPATLSGQGPDVAMMVGNDLPMNYGMRGAVMDLAQFDDFNEVTKAFLPSALVPYNFEDKYFALPETQSFNMLFYRKDILNELNLEPPETWDDVKSALSVLSKNYMSFGLPVTYNTAGAVAQQNMVDSTYAMFLFQAGGEFYNEEGTLSALDSDISVATFREFTKYFTDYKLPNPYDFANRFRTGEMPMAIADYTNYNTLQVFAPEIKGLWGFTKVPGTVRADGSIDHSVATGGNASIIMERSKRKDAAWQFIKWWVSADTQNRFGRAMEALMGPSARYNTANQEAFAMLPWPVSDYKELMAQFEEAKGVPQVPGGYFTPRQINNAFFKVVSDTKKIGPREALTDFTRYINDEIAYKRKEFGLD